MLMYLQDPHKLQCWWHFVSTFAFRGCRSDVLCSILNIWYLFQGLYPSVPACTHLYPFVPRLLSAQCFPHTTILWPGYFVTLFCDPWLVTTKFSGTWLGLNYPCFKSVFIQVLCIKGPYILAGLHISHFHFHCVLLYCNLYPYISLTLVIVE